MGDFGFNTKLWEPRHNAVAFLEDNRDSAVPFRQMIQFLRRSRIYTAITATTIIYQDHVRSFWKAAILCSDLYHTRIISRVFDREVVITEQLIREFFHFNDNPDFPVQFSNVFIAGGMTRMGYPGVPTYQYRKANLTRVWRYLMHIMIGCLSSRKAGFDWINHQTASAMMALVYNKPYNFSGYIFRAMVDNVKAGDQRWNMYPRFVQLLLNHSLPGLPVNAIHRFRQTPMNLRTFAACGSYGRGVQAPADVPLFGHIVDVNYLPPPNDGFDDPVVEESPINEQAFVDVPVREHVQPVDALLDTASDIFEKIENYTLNEPEQGATQQATQSLSSSNADDEDDDGGSTPADSEGDVPPPASLENIRRFNLPRFKRIQRRMRQGRVHVPANRGKRTRDADSDTDPDYHLESPLHKRSRAVPVSISKDVQPQPAVLKQILDDIQKMNALITSQATVIEGQASRIAELEKTAARVPALETRILVLEALAVVSGVKPSCLRNNI